ncbi:hypothetical protein [Microbacterium telephonicum]|uniref:Uncharacterized protein n=1 Tax=Microbacterium telephonicum TaxID=1714841 RepID=A0A498BXH8_9MICO|nr:hypothetical protein [Microbacterium telephonicum]RLK47617.1 hypothetical protein C7474_2209 [Microbacterium telephonicum]
MVYTHHRDALRAAVRAEYKIGLRDVGVLELADLTAWLPAGCVLWQAYGGPLARSREEQALLLIDYRLRQQMWVNGGKKGKAPEYPKDPPLAGERATRDAVNDRKADAYRRRQAKALR